MQTSVQDVLTRRSRSRFYSGRCCLVSEKRVKVFSMLLLVAGLTYYAYNQVITMIKAYGNPSREVQLPLLPSLKLPGILICSPFVNLSDNSLWYAPTPYTLFQDPRTTFAPFVHMNSPLFNGVPFLIDCCFTTQFDFFTACYSLAVTCPVPTRFRQNLRGTYVPTAGSSLSTWNMALTCLDIAPGVTFRQSSDNLFIPFYNVVDNGVLATESVYEKSNATFFEPHLVSTAANPFDDVDYRNWCDNSQYWTSRYTVMSYMPSEYNANPVDIFFNNGNIDALIGGSQNRIRTDIGRGIASMLVTHYKYWDVNGKLVTANTGWTTSYDMTVASLPWTISPSSWNPSRQRSAELGLLRIHVDLHETQTREFISFPYLNIITAFLTIIGSATTLSQIIIGRGEYDPTGLLNKLFYYDVPVLKEAASDHAAETTTAEQPKKSVSSDEEDDEPENE